MAIYPQQLTIYLYSAHRAVIFAIAQLSCYYCTVFICTCFLFCIAKLSFSYSDIQPQVYNKTQCKCQMEQLIYYNYSSSEGAASC